MDPIRFNYLLRKIKYDKSAFDELYTYYFAKIVLHITRCFRGNIAEDIANSFFMKLLDSEATPFVRSPNVWVYRCCDNLAINWLKRESPFTELDEQIPDPTDWFSLISDSEENVPLLHALRSFDETDQKIFYLRYWEGYQLNEIAEQLGMPYTAVRKRHARAKIKLKEKISKK